MPNEVTLTTLFSDGGYTASGHEGSHELANQNSFTYSLIKYTQDQGENPSNNSAFRLILDKPPEAVVSARIVLYLTNSYTEEDCPHPVGQACQTVTKVTANVFGKPSVNAAGMVFFPLENHDGGAYVRAAATCLCQGSTKSRRLRAFIGVRTINGGGYTLKANLIPCMNCNEESETITRKQKKRPVYEVDSLVKRIDDSFDLLRAWNEHEI